MASLLRHQWRDGSLCMANNETAIELAWTTIERNSLCIAQLAEMIEGRTAAPSQHQLFVQDLLNMMQDLLVLNEEHFEDLRNAEWAILGTS